jgi:hypothetical protein
MALLVQLPAVEVVPARRFPTANRRSGEPQNEEHRGHDPQEVKREANAEKDQNYQKCQQK